MWPCIYLTWQSAIASHCHVSSVHHRSPVRPTHISFSHLAATCGCDFVLDPASPASRFLSHEQRMLNFCRAEYKYLEQGSAIFQGEVVLPKGTVPSRASFSQGDACSLDVETLGSFDAVLASNLLCRCSPAGCPHWLCTWVLESMNLARAKYRSTAVVEGILKVFLFHQGISAIWRHMNTCF